MAETETFEGLRPYLFAVAYRMLGSASDAEDVVQEAFLRYQGVVDKGAEVASLRAYLSTVVTRLSMDHLRSARVRRETYVGTWLPEPLLTDEGGDGAAAAAADAESLSMAFLLLLERLNPVERAAFLLHDVFGYGYHEIAPIIEKSEANSRQITARARRRIRADRPKLEASPQERDRLADRFFAAVQDGDLDGLVQLLAEDAAVYGDGGGKAPQWSVPIIGVDRVARLFQGLGLKLRELGLRIERRQVNGQPGAAVRDRDGRLVNVFALDVADGMVRTVRSVINPDKLRRIGPVADARALAREGRAGRRAGRAGDPPPT